MLEMNLRHGRETRYNIVSSSGPVQKEWSSSRGGMFSAYFIHTAETHPNAHRQNMRETKLASFGVRASLSTPELAARFWVAPFMIKRWELNDK